MKQVVLDHVDGLTLDEEGLKKHFNELRTLEYLFEGLAYLNAQVMRIEDEVKERESKKILFAFGNAPQFSGVPQGLVACSFHWYAVSACNFVRLIGWIGHEEDHARARSYLTTVMPEVERWRNKVAAHFAILDPRKDDSFADLAASVTFPIGFKEDSFWTQPFTLGIGASKESASRQDMQWSLTDTHKRLGERYWRGSKQTEKESEASYA